MANKEQISKKNDKQKSTKQNTNKKAETQKSTTKKPVAKKSNKEIVIKEEDIIHIEYNEKPASKNTKKNSKSKSNKTGKRIKEDNNKIEKKENRTKKENRKNENKKQNKNTIKKAPSSKTIKRKILITIIQILLVAIMIFSGIKIYLWLQENKKSSDILENIQDSIVKIEPQDTKQKKRYTVNFSELKEKNSDTVAWLKVEGTNIELPIVKAEDNSYYLDRSFDKNYNSAGWPFMDYHNKADGTDKNIIIYGHNRKDGSMFGSLSNILNEDWQNNEENKYITLITENENAIYEVFSVYRIEDEDYYIKTNFITGAFGEFVEKLKNRSYKDFGNTVNGDDTILTLSTCDDNNNYRVVLHAKKITEEEYLSK